MASDSNSTASPPSSSKSQPLPPRPPPPPPPSDDEKSPPSALPPPPSEQNSNSSFSTPPPPSGNGEDKRSSSPVPTSPPLPVPSSQTSKQGFSSPPTHHLLSPPIHKSTSGSSGSGSGSGLPSSGDNGAQFDITPVIAIAAGAGILLLVVLLLAIEYSKKKKRSESPMYYYNHGNHADDHCKNTTPKHQQWNNGYKYNNGEQIHFVPPPPGVGAKGWVITPPPLSQLHSSDMSNSSYSGPQGTPLPPPHPSVALGFNKSTFTFDELSAATGGFAQGNLLGQGGFGYVHKGVLPNGKEIAVKSLKSAGGQGDKEFQAEVEVINRVHHRHLVSLVGYCISEGKNLLVYEFVPNKTLEFHLHGKDLRVMEWSTRLKIAIGSAKGLAYLHEDCHPRIIHRDIKGPNILIDDNFEAKVADFGLAKFNQDNNTHISTRVMGTFGYMAPEYASSGKLTEKSDVFSFGVMLLELITGRPPVDTTGDYEEDSLVEWARPLCTNALENGDYKGLVDPRLENNYDKQEMARMVACAAASVRHSARKRPKMSQIVRALDGNVSLDDLSEGVKPGQSSIFNNSSGEYDASTYNADMKRFRKLALDSSYASSDGFGGTSNEFGAYASSNDSVEYGKQTDRKPDAHSLRDL